MLQPKHLFILLDFWRSFYLFLLKLDFFFTPPTPREHISKYTTVLINKFIFKVTAAWICCALDLNFQMVLHTDTPTDVSVCEMAQRILLWVVKFALKLIWIILYTQM